MDILRDLRRRSLQLDSDDDVERFRMAGASERRASINVGIGAEKKTQHHRKFSVQRSTDSFNLTQLFIAKIIQDYLEYLETFQWISSLAMLYRHFDR